MFKKKNMVYMMKRIKKKKVKRNKKVSKLATSQKKMNEEKMIK